MCGFIPYPCEIHPKTFVSSYGCHLCNQDVNDSEE